MNMERNDLYVFAGAILLSLLAGLVAKGVQSVMMLAQITIWLTVAAGLTVVLALIAIYYGRKPYGGEVARNLEVIGFGLALFIVTYIPHVIWHVMGLAQNNPLGPGWAGFSTAWWAGFFHVGAIMFFLISSYGYYLFWRQE